MYLSQPTLMPVSDSSPFITSSTFIVVVAFIIITWWFYLSIIKITSLRFFIREVLRVTYLRL